VRTTTGTEAEPRARGLIESLTGLRGVLGWSVFVVHAGEFFGLLVPALAPGLLVYGRAHYFALDTFFLLSGYVITAGYRRKFASRPMLSTYARFLWSRLSRFYPLHLAVLIALVLVVGAAQVAGVRFDRVGDAGDVLRHVVLVQGWGGAESLTWNVPAWTISSQWFGYLIAPVVVMGVVRLRRSTTVVACYVASLAVVLAAYAVLGFDDEHLTAAAPLWRAVGGFVAGALLFHLAAVGSRIPALCGRWTGPLVVLLLGMVVGLSVMDLPTMVAEPLLGLVLLGVAQERGAISRMLASRGTVWLGQLSVALYLTHYPYLMLASRVVTPERFPGAWGWVGILVLSLGALGTAYVAYVLIEIPGTNLMRRMEARAATRRPTAQGSPVAVPASAHAVSWDGWDRILPLRTPLGHVDQQQGDDPDGQAGDHPDEDVGGRGRRDRTGWRDRRLHGGDGQGARGRVLPPGQPQHRRAQAVGHGVGQRRHAGAVRVRDGDLQDERALGVLRLDPWDQRGTPASDPEPGGHRLEHRRGLREAGVRQHPLHQILAVAGPAPHPVLQREQLLGARREHGGLQVRPHDSGGHSEYQGGHEDVPTPASHSHQLDEIHRAPLRAPPCGPSGSRKRTRVRIPRVDIRTAATGEP